MISKTFWTLGTIAIFAINAQGQPSGWVDAQGQPIGWFDNQSIYNTVLLEKIQRDSSFIPQRDSIFILRIDSSFIPHGTGFLIYNYENEARPTLVTCKHLLKGSEIYVVVTADSELISCMKEKRKRFIPIGNSTWMLQGNVLRLRVNLQEGHTYVTHPDTSLDIAAIPIGLGARGETKLLGAIKLTKTIMFSKSGIGERSKSNLGEDVYFVGFPFGIGSKGILCPLVRSGAIAWLSTEGKEFLLDAFSYPGNSGSPVYLKNIPVYPCLIGMVIGHLGPHYENFGLARCVWVDDILTVVALAKKL